MCAGIVVGFGLCGRNETDGCGPSVGVEPVDPAKGGHLTAVIVDFPRLIPARPIAGFGRSTAHLATLVP